MNTKTKIRLAVAAGLAVLAVIWILQNGGIVESKFLFFTVVLPKPALLAITLLAGMAAGIFISWSLSDTWNKPKST